VLFNHLVLPFQLLLQLSKWGLKAEDETYLGQNQDPKRQYRQRYMHRRIMDQEILRMRLAQERSMVISGVVREASANYFRVLCVEVAVHL
jgi:hypothetical protein